LIFADTLFGDIKKKEQLTQHLSDQKIANVTSSQRIIRRDIPAYSEQTNARGQNNQVHNRMDVRTLVLKFTYLNSIVDYIHSV
jgi:hypothetical protein